MLRHFSWVLRGVLSCEAMLACLTALSGTLLSACPCAQQASHSLSLHTVLVLAWVFFQSFWFGVRPGSASGLFSTVGSWSPPFYSSYLLAYTASSIVIFKEENSTLKVYIILIVEMIFWLTDFSKICFWKFYSFPSHYTCSLKIVSCSVLFQWLIFMFSSQHNVISRTYCSIFVFLSPN